MNKFQNLTTFDTVIVTVFFGCIAAMVLLSIALVYRLIRDYKNK